MIEVMPAQPRFRWQPGWHLGVRSNVFHLIGYDKATADNMYTIDLLRDLLLYIPTALLCGDSRVTSVRAMAVLTHAG